MRHRRALLLAGILLALSAGARIYRLEADPPREIVRGYQTHTHFRDEPAKAHEARNRALFGRWRLGDVDQYGLWARPSPVWAYGQYLWFSLFGVSWASARLYVVAYAVGGLTLLYGLVATHYGLLAAAAATIWSDSACFTRGSFAPWAMRSGRSMSAAFVSGERSASSFRPSSVRGSPIRRTRFS